MADADDGRWDGPQIIPVPDTTISDGASPSHTINDTRGLFVIHAALLRTGKVLWFCGHVENSHYATLSYEFNPSEPTKPLKPTDFPIGADLFCCHMVQLADGRILAMGGSEDFHAAGDASFGAKHIAVYDPETQRWAKAQTGGADNRLSQGRWYPTPLHLGDDRTVVVSGRRERGTLPPLAPIFPYPFIADQVEILSPPNFASTVLTTATRPLPIYPGLHLAPNGKIYFTHTTWRQEMANPETMALDMTTGMWTVFAGVRPPQPRREEGMSVLLPPAQDGKILVIGGGHAQTAANATVDLIPTFDHVASPEDCATADILDTNTNTWTTAPGAGVFPNTQMFLGHTNGHCVLLPDETVLIVGGHDGYKWSPETRGTTATFQAEIFTPSGANAGFRRAALMGRDLPDTRREGSRMYHSIALLLPDGRVIVAGGADPNFEEPNLTYPTGWAGPRYGPTATPPLNIPLNQKTFEFYRPPYFFRGARPKIDEVLVGGVPSKQVSYGQQFVVRTAQAASIAKVAFMRPGCPTHHTDTEQRYVRLDVTTGAGELMVTAESNRNVAPPGFYMLWIIDSQGLPCEEAWFIQLAGAPPAGLPVPTGDAEKTCFIATATFGSAGHADVVYLQSLRASLRDASTGGRWFINFVNAIYYSFSRHLAQVIATRPWLRAFAHTAIVEPGVRAIAGADRLAASLAAGAGRQALLIFLLSLEGLAFTACAPILLVLLGIAYWRASGGENRAD